jgi:S-adenosylmethionine hydrolase
VAVIDPGVGTDRAILCARIADHQYIAPDNGLLSRVASRVAPNSIHRLENPEFWLEEVSSTFHGRDIMAPAAAHLSLGVEPARLGPPVDTVGGLEWPPVVIQPRRIEGVVLQIDSFGNLITNVRVEDFLGRPTDERVCVICSIYETWGIYSAYAQQPQDTLIALVGSSGHLELAIVGDSAARRLGIQVGTKVIVTWE